ncbi:hypothetical protein HAX54_006150 [Datura stramonium]|uniref:Uncharacterized protein n=1 Tax=Datura stramonium TaxID=4076 RepID=A0ABS8WTT4_DATST|nr:hypothetical protein [Datura stramonium]
MTEHCSVDENAKLKGKENMAEHCSGDENVIFVDLGMAADEDAYKVAPNSTPNICEVGVGGEKTKVKGGGVYFVVNDKAIVDSGVPRQDVVHPATYVVVEADDTLGRVANISNEPASGVFVEGVAVNQSVVDPPLKDATCKALVGQVACEVPGGVTYTFTGLNMTPLNVAFPQVPLDAKHYNPCGLQTYTDILKFR